MGKRSGCNIRVPSALDTSIRITPTPLILFWVFVSGVSWPSEFSSLPSSFQWPPKEQRWGFGAFSVGSTGEGVAEVSQRPAVDFELEIDAR